MSMNGFFKAFSRDQINAMFEDYSLIDEWVWKTDKSSHSTDVETCWDVLSSILGRTGFLATAEIDHVLSNGCSIITPKHVKEHQQGLSRWSHAEVLQGLRRFDGDEDIYHLDIFSDEGEEYLLEQFDKLVAFYAKAAENDQGVVFYLA